MALDILWVDSFDSYGSGALADLTTEAYSTANASSASFGAGVTGNAVSLVTNTDTAIQLDKTLSSAQSRLKVHVRWSYSSVVSTRKVVAFYSSGTLQAYVEITSSNTIRVKNGVGTQLATASVTLAGNTFYHLEIDITFNSSTGAFDVYHEGTLVMTATGVNTTNGGGNQANIVSFGSSAGTGSSVTFKLDDLIIQSGSGDFPLGQLQVHYSVPTAAGNSNANSDEAGAGNSSNYQSVDESPSNGDTDYIKLETSGNIDLYTMGDLTPTSGTIKAVVVKSQAKLNVPGAKTYRHKVRTNSTNYNGSAIAPTTSYADYITPWYTNPNTSVSWTIAEVNALEAGFEAI